METQKRDSFYFAGGGFHCEKASNSIAGDYRTAACQGLACTPSEEIDVTRPYLSILKSGLAPQSMCRGDAEVLNER